MATYYVSVDGDDSNDGLTSATPWKTLAKPSETIFAPGDFILLKRGDLFRGRLRPTFGPITISNYGDPNDPLPELRNAYDKSNPADWTLVDSSGIWKTFMWEQEHGNPNIVYNGSFSTGNTSGWDTFKTNGASGLQGVIPDELNPGNKCIAFYISNPGVTVDNYLFYSTSAFPTEKDRVYEISFYARCVSGAQSATIYGCSLQQNGVSGYSLLERESTKNVLTMTSAWKQFKQYVVTSASESNSRVVFGFGGWQTSAGFPTSGLTFLMDEIEVRDVGYNQDHYDRVRHDCGQVWLDGKLYGRKYTNVSAGPVVSVSSTTFLSKDGDFSSDYDTWELFVKSSTNPATRNAEIAMAWHGVLMRLNQITLSGLDINRTAGNGVDLSNTSGCRVYNCKIHHIGGSNLYYTDGRIIRQGNAINAFEGNRDLHVKDNWFYQCYDVAVTPQGNAENYIQDRIVFERNLINNNEQTFEFWGKKVSSKMFDIKFIDNFCVDAGNSWSRDIRPDKKGCHILQYDNYSQLSGCDVSGNTFYMWRDTYKLEQIPINFTSGLSFYSNKLMSRKEDPIWTRIESISPLTVSILYTVESLNQYTSESGKEQNSSGTVIPGKRRYGVAVRIPKENLPDHPAFLFGNYPEIDPGASYYLNQWILEKF